MATGAVKFFNRTRGFGFIVPDQGSKGVFVHVSALERSGLMNLTEGQKIGFDIQPAARGPRAVDLKAV